MAEPPGYAFTPSDTSVTNPSRTTSDSGSNDVVMSWDSSEPYGAYGGTTVFTNERPAPSIEPPSYAESGIPTSTVTYVLSQKTFNTMIISPDYQRAIPAPVYHVSVAMNCLCPDSYITTLRRGTDENATLVAEFELGGPKYKETVYFRGNEMPLRSIVTLRESPEKGNSSFRWNVTDKMHLWMPDAIPFDSPLRRRKADLTTLPLPMKCTSMDKLTYYARFFPAVELRERGNPSVLSKLLVEPVVFSEKLLDNVVTSCLVVERWRSITMKRGIRD